MLAINARLARDSMRRTEYSYLISLRVRTCFERRLPWARVAIVYLVIVFVQRPVCIADCAGGLAPIGLYRNSAPGL